MSRPPSKAAQETADRVRQALGHEWLATTNVYVELAREVMDQELQRNAF